MKLQPVTLVLVLVAALLGGFVYFSQVRGSSQPEATENQGQKLFGFAEKQVKSFTLKTQLRSLSFERDPQGKWQMLAPDKVAASEPAVAYLLNLLATASSDRVLGATATDQKEFGFEQPMAIIEITLDNRETHRLVLGGYDFNHSNVYAQADPPTDTATALKVLLVSPEFDNAVNRSLADWKQSASNTAIPTPTAAPAPASPITAPTAPTAPTASPKPPQP